MRKRTFIHVIAIFLAFSAVHAEDDVFCSAPCATNWRVRCSNSSSKS